MGAVWWRFKGVPASSRNSQCLPDPADPLPLTLPPLSWPHFHPCGSPITRAQATLLLAQPGPLSSLEDLSPQGAWGPIQQLQTLRETEYSLGVPPAGHLEHVLSFWLYPLEFSEMSF